jgi:hypothetical protein
MSAMRASTGITASTGSDVLQLAVHGTHRSPQEER